MNDPERDFCLHLAESFPDVKNILREHLSDNDELLSHNFMADVTRYVAAGGPERAAIVRQLEDAFALDKDVEELIGVSFVENL